MEELEERAATVMTQASRTILAQGQLIRMACSSDQGSRPGWREARFGGFVGSTQGVCTGMIWLALGLTLSLQFT